MNRLIRDLSMPLLRLAARMRSRRFDHVVTLGYNCELSARFFQNFKFVDSTLFSWASAIFPEKMAYAIEHYEDIFSGEIAAPTKTFPLFLCKKTGVRAHGRSKMAVWTASEPPSQEFIDAERAELVSRFEHLKKKTIEYLRDDKSVLAMLKLQSSCCKPGKANESVMCYVNALKKIGARNMTFLVVCEQANASAFVKPHPEFELRTVAEYNPEDHAADLKRGDSRGWRLIFDEFRPKAMKKQAHKFKFEEDDAH